MAKKKEELFANERDVLQQARTSAENASLSEEAVRDAFKKFCEEYETLLDEATFLSRTSDKLAAKLSNKFEKAEMQKDEKEQEANMARNEKEKVLLRNRKLQEEKTEGDVSRSKLQFTMLILIALLVVVIILFVYWFFLRDMLGGGPGAH